MHCGTANQFAVASRSVTGTAQEIEDIYSLVISSMFIQRNSDIYSPWSKRNHHFWKTPLSLVLQSL